MKRENDKRIVATMIREYCHRRHGSERGALCPDCAQLLDYAVKRLDHCPYHTNRSSCRRCVIHCYGAAEREQMRQIMAYIGPRMIYLHPFMAIRHLWCEMRQTRSSKKH